MLQPAACETADMFLQFPVLVRFTKHLPYVLSVNIVHTLSYRRYHDIQFEHNAAVFACRYDGVKRKTALAPPTSAVRCHCGV